MQRYAQSQQYIKVLKWATALLMIKVLLSILSNYVDYFPPNFDAYFLMHRELYFFGLYGVAFYEPSYLLHSRS